jgi:hypothetical protein
VTEFLLVSLKGKTVTNPVGPKTGAPMQRAERSLTLEYKGARTTLDMPGWYSDASNEGSPGLSHPAAGAGADDSATRDERAAINRSFFMMQDHAN